MNGELTEAERDALAEVERQHRPADDWKCECGSDCFGGSAAYSTQLFVAHYLDEMGAAVERIVAARRESLAERVKALADEWTHATCQTDGAPCSWHRVSAECADELTALLDPSETP